MQNIIRCVWKQPRSGAVGVRFHSDYTLIYLEVVISQENKLQTIVCFGTIYNNVNLSSKPITKVPRLFQTKSHSLSDLPDVQIECRV